MRLDAETQSLEKQLQIVRDMPAGDLFGAAFMYNWDSHPYEVLGAIADRPDCSLLTALRIFTQASPSSYSDEASQLRKPHHVAFLDRIQRRINAGGYRHDTEDHERLWERRHFDWEPETSVAPFLNPSKGSDGSSALTVWWLDPRVVLPACTVPSEVDARIKAEEKDDLERRAQNMSKMLGYSDSVPGLKNLLANFPDDLMQRAEEIRQRPTLRGRLSSLFSGKKK